MLLVFVLLSLSAWGQQWPDNPDFPGPLELRRAATDLRLNLVDLGPAQFRGGSNFGPGTPGGFTPGDLNKLSVAVSYFERACMRVEDPRDTLRAYQDLDRAYQRAWRAGPFGTASVRDFGQIMERLERFYAQLE